ncbi:dicarboxylate/amino acid:cation symporter [Lactobacillus sp. ESL0677]|uniref:dicarboxylate/amino acid:cation symporter n=1 Tax=Lactobacillus sp. ESL0677 TaxID=2983208 RepID=UPI0023F6D07F|nr:dicarboxylate/amino acid:cation symporter [Lactobacillus sp. ESL0677]WEV37076.1 dicarboxylate/amino acid:cation symporter [Lactobacillus sp. ESL0677]
MHKISLTGQITIGVIIGALVGWLLPKWAENLTIVGDIFLRLLQMVIVWLILGAVIEALGSLKFAELGKLGLKTCLWFTITTILAAVEGVLLGIVFKPGTMLRLPNLVKTKVVLHSSVNLRAAILHLFPDNIFASLTKGNVIQVIVFAVLFGLVLSRANENNEYHLVLKLIKQFNQLIVKLVMLIIKLAPLGIACMFASTIAKNGGKVFLPLLYFLVLYAVAVIVFLLALFIFVGLVAHVSFWGLVKGLTRIIVVAFTTTSSAATLPIEMIDAQEKLGVSKSVTQLVLPLGMALNSNGLALYLSLVCITLMQLYGASLAPVLLLRIILLAVLSCLGTVVVPGGGIVALTIALPVLGFPNTCIALFAGIDWFVGMFRAVANVVGDTITAVGVAASTSQLNRDVY